MPLFPRADAPHVTPGAAGSRVLLHVPHAGTLVPASARAHLLLDHAALAAEAAALTDHRTDVLALAAAERAAVRPWVVVNPVSRFVVDVERFPDEREEMAAVGMGAVYTHGTRGQRIRPEDTAHAEALLAAYFRPWGATVAGLVDAGRSVLLDVHSYPRDPLPYERHAGGPRPQVCLAPTPRTPPPGWWRRRGQRSRASRSHWTARSPAPTCPRADRRPRSWSRSAATSTPPARPSWSPRRPRWSTR
jgi:N-formylglutamate amidohydrolase